MIVQPLKAATIEEENLDQLLYPKALQPKLDGLRCLIVNGVPCTINMNPIPNRFIREKLSWCDHGLDGEITIPGCFDFNEVQSAVMKASGEPDFIFNVFDRFDLDEAFLTRFEEAEKSVVHLNYCKMVETVIVATPEQLLQKHKFYTKEGFEGTMIRSGDSLYKFGRSTLKEEILIKLKDWIDDEAIIVGFIQRMKNNNVKQLDNFGKTKRSSAKANKVPVEECAGVVLKWRGIIFEAGFAKGFNQGLKQWLFHHQKDFLNTVVTFKYQNLSKKGVPRFGKLKGFRSLLDMTEDHIQNLGVDASVLLECGVIKQLPYYDELE